MKHQENDMLKLSTKGEKLLLVPRMLVYFWKLLENQDNLQVVVGQLRKAKKLAGSIKQEHIAGRDPGLKKLG